MWDLQKFEKHIAIIDDKGTQVTYGDLINTQEQIAEKMQKRALVVSLCQNSVGSVVGYIAFMNSRMVPMLLNAQLESALLKNILSIYLPSYLWVPSDMITEDLFSDMDVVYLKYDYALLRTAYEKEYPVYEELGLLLTTSGSTGSPKFVRQSYDNIMSNAQSIVSYLELDETERPITTLPMNYTYGLSIINSHLLVGATLLVTDKSLMQKEFWEFFEKQQATSFGGGPYTYEILDKLRFTRMELSSLRTMTQAGGKLTTELHAKFAEYAAQNGKKFVVMYGQCEATARMGYLPANMAVEKCGSMGIAIPGGKFTLIDVDGKPVQEVGKTGELVYEGPNVTLGYAECGDDLRLGDEHGRILYTGDMAQYDKDGYFYIVGRKKRFLKIYGNRVNLDEVDRLIKGAFDGIDCASAGVDDHLYIFITEESKAKDVKNFVVQKTGLNQAAYQMVVIDQIPKNDAGKTLYRELEKYYKEL